MTLTLSVVGCGYLGATHAACMSSLGFTVVGVDTDPEKVALLQSGKLPFYEPGLDTLLEQEMKTGRLSFTTDFSAVKDADVHFVCVGTPQSKDGLAADLTYVKSAVAAIAPHLKEGALVVGKSTVPVGTAQGLREELAKIAPQADLVLVVGSTNSSNSVRLVEVAKEYGTPNAYLLDFAAEAKEEWLVGVETIGVTSGASVPEILVNDLLIWLAERGFGDVQTITAMEESLLFSLPPELRKDMKAAGAK